MKIKDLRHYRKFFKEEIRESSDLNRDVHFIGTDYYDVEKKQTTFGFFDVYHGQKSKGQTEGIKGFLKGFLDMAQDAQAIYEFLQNAVDADSSHFTMVWGTDDEELNEYGLPTEYLMVLNNGKQFDFPAMESILNVGVSEKLEHEHTIGKFGIGFKLAHRLVGKENGLEELVENNSGPILFSWKNHELTNLLNEMPDQIFPVVQDFKIEHINGSKKVSINTDEPWLLKILIANFPAQPDELIRDAYFRERKDIFTTADVQKIRKWISKYRDVIPFEKYKTGSLFFLRLGTDKAKTLEGDYILEGIKFSMSILSHVSNLRVQGLKKVHLNGTDIENVPLKFESITISKNSEDYNYVRFGKKSDLTDTEIGIAEKDADIQFLFGYTDYKNADEIFKNAPNFYLYFPMTEEKHGLKFILHTNAFYKKSARTSLHSDAINIRLLSKFAEKIIETVKNDPVKFIEIYPLLLSAKKSIDSDKLWINKPLIEPLQLFVSSNIPVLSNNPLGYDLEHDKDRVRIKKTKVDVYDNYSSAPFKWFYFSNDPVLEGAVAANLNLYTFNIANLLRQPNIYPKINVWLNNEEDKILTFIDELKTIVILLDSQGKTILKENLFDVKFLRFSTGEVLSINEFQQKEEQGYLYKFKEFEGVEDILIKLGLFITVDNIDEPIEAFRNNFSNKSQLKDYVAMAEIFSNCVSDEKLDALSNLEKYRLYKAFDEINQKAERQVLPSVKIYKNNLGVYRPFRNLIKYEQSFLKNFSIDEIQLQGIQNITSIERRLKFDPTRSYEDIFYPMWSDVLSKIIKNPKQNISVIRGDIEYSFKNSSWDKKDEHHLVNHNLLIHNSTVISTDKILLYKEGISLEEIRHKEFQKIALETFETHLPDLKFLELISDKEPYSFKNRISKLKLNIKELDLKRIQDILKLCDAVRINFFQENLIIRKGDLYDIISDTPQKQYYSSNSDVCQIVDSKLSNAFVSLPLELSTFEKMVFYKDKNLFEAIIGSIGASTDEKDSLLILKLILSQDVHTQTEYFKKLNSIEFLTQDTRNANIDFLKLLYNIRDSFTNEELQQKIIISDGTKVVALKDQPVFLEKISILNIDIPYSNLLPSVEHQNEQIIKNFINTYVHTNDFSKSFFNRLFKIQIDTDKEELKRDFLRNLPDNNLLLNIDQLFFVIASGIFDENEITDFKVLNTLEQPININNNRYFNFKNSADIISSDVLLAEKYAQNPQLTSLLIRDFQNDKFKFLDSFKITHNSDYNDLKQDTDIFSKILFLFDLFELSNENERFIDEEKVARYLNVPQEQFYVFARNDDNTAFSEKITRWAEDNSIKRDFLKKIGFVFDDDVFSLLIKLCKGEISFVDNMHEVTEKEFTNLLRHLYENKIEISIDNEEAVIALRSLYNKFRHSTCEQFIPCYSSITKIIIKQNFDIFSLENEILELAGNHSGFIKDWERLYANLKIVYNDFLEHTICVEVPVTKILLDENASELTTYYYNEWKKDVHNLRLFEAEKLRFKVKLSMDHEDYTLGHLELAQFYTVEAVGNTLKLFFTKDLTVHYLTRQLENETEFETYNLSLSLRKLEEKHNSFNTQITEALKNTDLDELRDMFEAQIKKQEQTNKRENIAARITDLTNQNLKYSKQWFIEYLDYLKTFDENSNSTEFKTIRFRKIEKVGEVGFYRLSSASAYIPENIDEAQNRKMNVIFGSNKKESIELSFISKKNQDLIIKSNRNFTESELAAVFLTELVYIPNIDLLNRLETAFRKLSPWADYKESFPPVNFIYGPPGTGKTTELQKHIIKTVVEKPDSKTLILTPTNKACDVIAKRLHENKFFSFLRLSGQTSDEVPEEYYNNKLGLPELLDVSVLISTIHRFPYYNWDDKVEDNFLKNLEDFWDYLIIDEASMITLPYITFACMCAIQKNKNVKIIIAGDPKQIPPIPELNDSDLELIDVRTENIYSMFELDSFQKEEQHKNKRAVDDIKNLPIQYRSVPAIGKLFSAFSYGGNVQSKRTESDLRYFPVKIAGLFSNPVNFLSVKLNADDPLYAHNKLLYSSYHIYTTILITEILKYMEDHVGEEKWSVGIISPYKSQAVLINKLISDFGLSGKLKIIADTVHGFQGDECDIIFYLVTPNGNRYSGDKRSLLSKDYIYNVAISRAMNYLVVVHPFDDIRNNIHINKIENIVSKHALASGAVIKAKEIEEAILGSSDFIDKKTLVGGHDNVNIYTDFSWKYYVKRSGTAIDFQCQTKNILRT